jgi:hypothetical protein
MNKKCLRCPIHLRWLRICFAVSSPPDYRWLLLPSPHLLAGDRKFSAYQKGKTSISKYITQNSSLYPIKSETDFVANYGGVLILETV